MNDVADAYTSRPPSWGFSFENDVDPYFFGLRVVLWCPGSSGLTAGWQRWLIEDLYSGSLNLRNTRFDVLV